MHCCTPYTTTHEFSHCKHDHPPGPTKARWGSGLQKWVTDRLITRIVDSLQIHVREVHVRYEVCRRRLFRVKSLGTRSCAEVVCCLCIYFSPVGAASLLPAGPYPASLGRRTGAFFFFACGSSRLPGQFEVLSWYKPSYGA